MTEDGMRECMLLEIAKSHDKISRIKSEREELRQYISDYLKENERLQSENTRLKADLSEAEGVIIELQSKIKYLTIDVNIYETRLKGADTIINNLKADLERVTAERDKAIEDAKKGTVCCTCAHYDKYCSPPNPDAGCRSWQWRGLEESK